MAAPRRGWGRNKGERRECTFGSPPHHALKLHQNRAKKGKRGAILVALSPIPSTRGATPESSSAAAGPGSGGRSVARARSEPETQTVASVPLPSCPISAEPRHGSNSYQDPNRTGQCRSPRLGERITDLSASLHRLLSPFCAPILLKGPTGHSTGVLGDGLEDPMGNYQVADLVGMDAVVVD